MNKRLLAVLAAMAFSSTAYAAPSVIFNGIDVTGASNQVFTNVTVEFDANGNVILTAPQYKLVDTTPKAAVPPSSAIPAQMGPSAATTPVPKTNPGMDALPDNVNPTYLLATFDSPGLLGYNVDVYINSRFFKTVTQGVAQQSFDISSFLHSGKNEITYRMIMAADSGTSSKATVEFVLSKMTGKQGSAIELSGQYATVKINGIDGAKSYSVEFMVP